MNIKQQPVDKLIPYANNARTHSPEQVAQIAASIREFGFNNPVLVDKENTVIAGHGRLLAARQLGLDKVPTIALQHLSDAQKKAYILADNKLALNAGWDDDLLKLELEMLSGADFDLDLIGFTVEEINKLISTEVAGNTDPDDIPPMEGEVISKAGDLWLLGNHRVLCGDSTSTDDIDTLMNGRSPDLVFSDPPYGIDVVQGQQICGAAPTKFGKIGGGHIVPSSTYKAIEGYQTLEAAKGFYDACVTLGYENITLWGGNYFTDFLPASRCWFIWDKQMTGNFSQAEMAWTSLNSGGVRIFKHLWNGISREGARKDELSKRVHPTQKPVGLFTEIFEHYGDFSTVFDGFLGSGSTLIAAEKTRRACYGIEIDPYYVDVIIKRWQDFTGDNAILESTGQTFEETRNAKKAN